MAGNNDEYCSHYLKKPGHRNKNENFIYICIIEKMEKKRKQK